MITSSMYASSITLFSRPLESRSIVRKSILEAFQSNFQYFSPILPMRVPAGTLRPSGSRLSRIILYSPPIQPCISLPKNPFRSASAKLPAKFPFLSLMSVHFSFWLSAPGTLPSVYATLIFIFFHFLTLSAVHGRPALNILFSSAEAPNSHSVFPEGTRNGLVFADEKLEEGRKLLNGFLGDRSI